MTYVTKYYSYVSDDSGNVYILNLKKKDYESTSTEIKEYSLNPFAINYRGGRKDYEDGKTIYPSSVEFTFYSKDDDDFSDILESEYKDFQLEVLKSGSTVYNYIDTTGSTEMLQDGTGRSWSLTGSTAYVFLNDGGNNVSRKLYADVNGLRNFKLVFRTFYSNNLATATINLLDSGDTVQHTQNAILVTKSGVPTDNNVTVIYTGSTPITRIEMSVSIADFFGMSAQVRWENGLEFYQGSSTSRFWQGWVSPDNITKSYIKDSFFLNLEATDGLLDLKDIDFPIAAASGSTRIINVLKAALDQTEIELDFEDQLNITESHISNSTLQSIYANTNRFVDTDDGVTRYLNCYDTLERLLSTFDCELAQVNGKWTITARHERQSDKHIYAHDSLEYITEPNFDRTIDISNYPVYFGSDEQSKIAPIRQTDITFQNRNLGESVIANGRFTDGTNGWTNGTGTTDSEFFVFATQSDQLYLVNREPNIYTSADGPRSFMSAPFPLEIVTTADTITVSLDARVVDINFSGVTTEVNPHIEIALKYPNGLVRTNVWTFIDNIISDAYSTYSHTFDIDQDGDYQLMFTIHPHDSAPVDDYLIFIDNITAVPTYDEDVEITFDNYYRVINNGNTAVQKTDFTIYFADTSNAGDVGALRYSPTGLTSSWSSHDGTITNKSIVELLGYYKLQQRNRFKDYLRITLKSDSQIHFNSILKINSQYYSIVGLYHDLRNEQLELDLVEFLTNDVSSDYSFNAYQLNTVDGKSSSSGRGGSGSGGGSADLSNYYTKVQTNSLIEDQIVTYYNTHRTISTGAPTGIPNNGDEWIVIY